VSTVKTPWVSGSSPLLSSSDSFESKSSHRTTARVAAPRRPSANAAAGRRRLDQVEYARGRSLGEIAKTLNTDGVPTAHGGRQWWPPTVRAVVLTFKG
jgi:hypothetical protein